MAKKGNNFDTTLASDWNSTDGSFIVKVAEGATAEEVTYPAQFTLEKRNVSDVVFQRVTITVSGRSGDVFTVTDSSSQKCVQDDTQPTRVLSQLPFDFETGDRVYCSNTAEDWNDLLDDVDSKVVQATYETQKIVTGSSVTGTDAYQITDADVLTYNDKQTFKISVDVVNTLGATFELNALGAKDIKNRQGLDTLLGGECGVNGIITLVYNATLDVMQFEGKDAVITPPDVTSTFSVYTAGETIAVGEAVYMDNATGQVLKTDDQNAVKLNFIGTAKTASTVGNPIDIYTTGQADGFTGLTINDKYYLSHDTGDITGYQLSGASYSSNSYNVTQDSNPVGVAFNSDGTKMFAIGFGTDNVFEYTLSIGYDLSSTVTYTGNSFSVSSQETTPIDVTFNTDGTKMYVYGNSSDSLNEYTLSVGFDLSSTVTYTGNSFSILSQVAFSAHIAFNNDGTKFYAAGSGNVFEYTVSVGFDLGSTVAYTGNSYNPAEDGTISGVSFNDDGTKFFLVGDDNNRVYSYTMSVAFDLSSTIAYTGNNFSYASQFTIASCIANSSDGLKFFIIGSSSDTIYEYDFATSVGPDKLGKISSTPGINKVKVGIATSATELIIQVESEFNDLEGAESATATTGAVVLGNAVGYLTVNVNGTDRKIPYYSV